MTHLNLRDRLLEATIAYVGSPRACRAHLDRMRDAPESRGAAPTRRSFDGASVVDLVWRPVRLADDAVGALSPDGGDLSLRLVFPEDGPPDALARSARDADGVVLLVDPRREALAENEAIRAALGSEMAARGDRPEVIVLLDGDGGDAMPEDELYATLSLAPWPRAASADEALAQAVAGALRACEATPETERERARDPNPLLRALRDAITTTLTAQIAELEGRVSDRLGGLLRTDAATIASRLDGLGARVTTLGERVITVSSRAATLEAAVRELTSGPPADAALARVQAGIEGLRADLAAIESVARSAVESANVAVEEARSTRARLDQELGPLQQKADTLVAAAARGAEDAADTRTFVGRAVARLDPLERAVLRAVEAGTTRVERATQASAEPIGQLAARVAELPTALASMEARTGERLALVERAAKAPLGPLSELTTRVAELPAAIGARDDRGAKRLETLEAALAALAEQIRADGDARQTALSGALDEVLEDVRRRKKGWFGLREGHHGDLRRHRWTDRADDRVRRRPRRRQVDERARARGRAGRDRAA